MLLLHHHHHSVSQCVRYLSLPRNPALHFISLYKSSHLVEHAGRVKLVSIISISFHYACEEKLRPVGFSFLGLSTTTTTTSNRSVRYDTDSQFVFLFFLMKSVYEEVNGSVRKEI